MSASISASRISTGRLSLTATHAFWAKVVLVNVTGSWCPNCHDESPYLAELYRKYRKLGLEIVALNFEEAEQLKDPTRLRAYVKRYGIEYPVLLGGTQSEVNAQAAPSSQLEFLADHILQDRNGHIRKVHVGFAAPASGEFNTLLKEEFTTRSSVCWRRKQPRWLRKVRAQRG